MRKELEEKIFAAAPTLFRNRVKPVYETCMCWGIECEDGWFEPILRLVVAAEEVNRMLAPLGLGVFADQVKQKWAGLRFYWSLGELDDGAAMDFPEGGPEERLVESADTIMDALVLQAERDCDCTCEICGKWMASEREAVVCGSWLTRKCPECARAPQLEERAIRDFGAGFDFLDPFSDGLPVKYGDRSYNTFLGAYYGALRPDLAAAFDEIGDARDVQNFAVGIGLATADDRAAETMEAVLRARYRQHDRERAMLAGVAGMKIEWRNRVHENFWGACSCEKCSSLEHENRYGKILERLAAECAAEADASGKGGHADGRD